MIIVFYSTSDTWKNKWSEIAILASPADVLFGHFKLFPDLPLTFVPGSKIMDFDANTIADLILNPLYNTDEKGTITLPYLVEHAHTLVTSKRDKNTFSLLNDFIDVSLPYKYKISYMKIYYMYVQNTVEEEAECSFF